MKGDFPYGVAVGFLLAIVLAFWVILLVPAETRSVDGQCRKVGEVMP
jgi:hypothetical protein